MLNLNYKAIIEAALFAAVEPMSKERLLQLFSEEEKPTAELLQETLDSLQCDYQERGVVLTEVALGYRFQTATAWSPWVSRLFAQKPPKLSRALLETLAIIAYRQPLTRGEIEAIRGVSVASPIIKTLMDNQWVQIVGHRDLPGKPALFATTPIFLNDFNLKALTDLPDLPPVDTSLTVVSNTLPDLVDRAMKEAALEEEAAEAEALAINE